MTKIDIFSGFLGAGKTTLIKKLIKEAYSGEKLVLIENEFGEIAVDGGFMKEAGIQVTEMSQGCICCSLVGDFGVALEKVITEYNPDRILIEPSGVGKLSDVIRAVRDLGNENITLNSFTTVVDAVRCKMYMKNFGEFFNDQVEHANSIVLSRTQNMGDDKLDEVMAMLKEHNTAATIITTSWDSLDGATILEAMEHKNTLESELELLAHEDEEECHRHDDDDEDECCHHHHHDDDDDDEHECCHHHHHDDDDDDEHECCHHHHHDDDDEHECCHHHHHDDDDEHECCHHHHHDDDDEHECCHHHHHDDDDDDEHECCHHHHHDDDDDDEHECCHHHHHDDDDDDEHECHHHHHDDHHDGHHHHHHHGHDADEVFVSWGKETARKFTTDSIGAYLDSLSDDEKYGIVVRAKGIVASADGKWIHFDYVPGEKNIRYGTAEVTGRLCVIGSKLNETALAELFGV